MFSETPKLGADPARRATPGDFFQQQRTAPQKLAGKTQRRGRKARVDKREGVVDA